MKNFAEQINKAMKPFREMQKAAGTFETFRNSMKPFQDVQKTFETINSAYIGLSKTINPLGDHLATFRKIGERLTQLATEMPEHLLSIAGHGWFIDFDSTLYFPEQINVEIKGENLHKAEELLIEYYSESIDSIFEDLASRHQGRSSLFREMKATLESGNYFSFIPLAFSQIDGICFDFTKKKFFIKTKKTFLPQVTEALSSNSGSFLELYLTPIKNQSPIFAHESELDQFPCKLNRHAVMHGTSLDYGTRINCLKVVSLLKYVSDLLVYVDERPSKPRK